MATMGSVWQALSEFKGRGLIRGRADYKSTLDDLATIVENVSSGSALPGECPTWATNPATVTRTGIIYIE